VIRTALQISGTICRQIVVGCLLVAVVVVGQAANASPPTSTLKITSPANGAIFAPGATVIVDVQPSAGASFPNGIMVIGTGGLGFAGPSTTAPYELTFLIPTNATPGPYQITAAAANSPRQVVISSPITIAVETNDAVSTLSAEPTSVTSFSLGEQVPIRIVGTRADGSSIDLAESSRMAFASTDSTVATVAQTGAVTSVGPGTATISATYDGGAQITIPVIIAPVIIPAPTRLDFGQQKLPRLSAAQSITLTNMRAYPLDVLQISTGGPFTQTNNCIPKRKTSGVLSPNGQCAVSVRFKPKNVGTWVGELSISTAATSAQTIVSLAGVGVR
jgi:hypothetical protein